MVRTALAALPAPRTIAGELGRVAVLYALVALIAVRVAISAAHKFF